MPDKKKSLKQGKAILKDPLVVRKLFSWLMSYRKKQKNDPSSQFLAMNMQANQHLTFPQLQRGAFFPRQLLQPWEQPGKHNMLPQPHPCTPANGPLPSLTEVKHEPTAGLN